LHPSNGPGVLITTVIFDWKNYNLWEKAVRIALRAKNQLGSIGRRLKKPTLQEGDDLQELQA